MSFAFDAAFRLIVMDFEGGAAVSHDAGGVSKYGFSQRYNQDIDVLSLTEDTARDRFRERHWKLIKGDVLPGWLAIALVDAEFNHGYGIAARALQRAVHTDPDGIIGPITTAAALSLPPLTVLLDFLSWRAVEYARAGRDEADEEYRAGNRRGLMKRLLRLLWALRDMVQ